MKIFSILLLASLTLISCGEKHHDQPDISAIEDGLTYPVQVKGAPQYFNIEDRMTHYKVPGVSIAVVKDGALLWEKGYGIANTETGDSVTTETLFQAGSISKPVAALAILQLVDEGKIELDADANNYLKDWKIPNDLEKKVTIRQLLSHTSGLNVMGFPGYDQKQRIPSVLEILEGKGNTPAIVVDTIPGSHWRYSGGGYTVLQKIVEDVSQMPFEEYMEKRVLSPMEMGSSTFVQPLPKNYHERASAAYDEEGNIVKGFWNNYPEKAAAGLWTTPADLAKYALEIQNILKDKEGILSPEITREMLTKHQFEWGLGPQLRKESDSLLFQHGGKNAGFTNMFIASAQQDFAFTIMTNGDNGRPLLAEIIRSISDYYGWNIANPQVLEDFPVSEKLLDQYAGRYQSANSQEVELMVDNKQLFLKDHDSPEGLILIPKDSVRFIELSTANEIVFRQNESGDFNGFSINGTDTYIRVK